MIKRKPLPTDDPVQRQPDIALARRHLGWEPRVRLEDGLEKAIRYFKALLEDSSA
jgi:UDP-glucuronate decarboxylase